MDGNEDEDELEKRKDIVEQFVIDQINDAIKHRDRCIDLHPEMENILNQFKTNKTGEFQFEPISKLVNKSKIDFENVLRLVKRKYRKVYIPASGAMSIVLRSGIGKVNSFADVRTITSSIKKTTLYILHEFLIILFF